MGTDQTITLTEARWRVARTLGIDCQPWDPDDVLWIADEWGIFRHELSLCAMLEEEIMGMELKATPYLIRLARDLGRGFRWWLTEAPFGLRLLVSVFVLFAASFVVGWLL